MTAFNRSNLDPSRREHFVYRAFDINGALLYVGCSMEHLERILPAGAEDGRYVSKEEVAEAERIEMADRHIYNARLQHIDTEVRT